MFLYVEEIRCWFDFKINLNLFKNIKRVNFKYMEGYELNQALELLSTRSSSEIIKNLEVSFIIADH